MLDAGFWIQDVGIQSPEMVTGSERSLMWKYTDLSEYKPVEGYKHVVLDEKKVPYIQNTTMKVVELVIEKKVYGWSPEELYLQHPYLNLGQIHSALAYYYDHINEIDRDIERRRQSVEKMRKMAGPSPLAAKLESEGLV